MPAEHDHPARPESWLSAFKRIVGMPDYPRYLDHMAAAHPGASVMTEREFYDQYISCRYGNGGTRCC